MPERSARTRRQLSSGAALLACVLVEGCAGRSGAGDAPPKPPEVAPAPILVDSLVERGPAPTKRQPLVETHHGRRVEDPYRWLEADDSAEVQEWTKRQNAATRSVLSRIAERDVLRGELERLVAVGEVSGVEVRRNGGTFRYFYRLRTGRQDHAQLLLREGESATPRIVLDPNTWSTEATRSLDWYVPSEDGARVAYGVSESGSEWSTLKVRDVETGRDLPDVIPRARHASVCWKPDGSGFYYTRYPARGQVPDGEEDYRRRLFEHTLGAPPERDPLVFGEGLELTDFLACDLSPNGRWLVAVVGKGWTRSDLYLADTRTRPLSFRKVTVDKEFRYTPIVLDDRIDIITNDGAPRYRVVTVAPEKAAYANFATRIPEHETDVLVSVEHARGHLVANYLRDGSCRLERLSVSGKTEGPIALPDLGTCGKPSGHVDSPEVFVTFDSFTRPRVVHRLDTRSGALTEWAHVPSPVEADQYRVERRHARSADGTEVPFFVVRRTASNEPAPTLLYGYGGFNVNLTPRFTPTLFTLLDRGVTYVQATLRGGGEFGEDWHRAGMRGNKQHVFDDFIAVAEELVRSGVTRKDELAISGRSNGGLLVSAAVTQRPDLFRAAIAGVPLTDMLRFDRFLIGKLWRAEYGDPEQPEAFGWLAAYSPYHRVTSGVSYPALLITTGEHDGRVHPMHARKFAAALQHATASSAPVLFWSETRAGHGAGKPRYLAVEEDADAQAFLLWQLGLTETPRGE